MHRLNQKSDVHAWMCTAYHEAGHAVAALLLERDVYLVEVSSRREGVVWFEGRAEQIIELGERANREGRVRVDLLRLWRDEFWIADAGSIAEEEFNLVPPDVLARGGYGDVMSKLELIPTVDDDTFVAAYFYRRVGPNLSSITEACRAVFRKPKVAALTQTLAEVLLRSRRLEEEEVIDVLLANRAAVDGQRDLFWKPVREDLFVHRQIPRIPQQQRLL